MASVRSFHKYRGAASITLDRLMDILREQIPLIAPLQTRYRVTDVPSARTIRFYTARGLVDKPVTRDGTRSLYGYRHILQLLVVKYLQSQYLPLVKVRALVADASNRDLELLVPEIAPAVHRGLAREDRRIVEQLAARPAATLEAGLREAPASPEDAGASAMITDAWHRIEVSPGIELHVLDAALTATGREQLRGALLRELGRMRGWG